MATIIEAAKWMLNGKTVERANPARYPVLRSLEPDKQFGSIVNGIGRGAISLCVQDLLADDWQIVEQRKSEPSAGGTGEAAMSAHFNIEALHRRSWELMTRGTISDFWRKPERIEAMNIFKRIARLGIPPRPNFLRYCQRDAEIRDASQTLQKEWAHGERKDAESLRNR